MAYTFSMQYCPYCNKTINWNYETGRNIKSKIGETVIYRCPHCKKVISNGLKEWPEMTSGEKTDEKFKFFWSCFGAGLIYGVGGGGVLMLFIEPLRSMFIWPLVIGFCLVATFAAFGYKNIIKESIERYNKKQERSLNKIETFDAKSLDISENMKLIKTKIDNLGEKSINYRII